MSEFKPSKFKYRTLFRVILEAETPLAVGTGMEDMESDSLIARDINGLPYIPGTSITGVVRSILDPGKNNPDFGYAGKENNLGSRIIISDGLILDSKSTVMDGLRPNAYSDPLLSSYEFLPVRQHVAIESSGAAKRGAKFDNEVVYAGTRFCIEIEYLSECQDCGAIKRVISAMRSGEFRLGGGTRKGYGKMKVISTHTASLSFDDKNDIDLYLAKSSNLFESASWKGWTEWKEACSECEESRTDEYVLSLKPYDFFLFGSGHGDDEGMADSVPVREGKVEWDGDSGKMKESLVLIPGTSVKGAVRHRTEYYLNAMAGNFADRSNEVAEKAVAENMASLFGKVDDDEALRGNVIVSDLFISDSLQSKYINHVSIDSMTGGAIAGALFTEKADYAPEQVLTIRIAVHRNGQSDQAIAALERSMKDICDGHLSLGGGTSKGYGMFCGTISKNGAIL